MPAKKNSNYDQILALEQSKVLAEDSQAYEYDAVYDQQVQKKRDDLKQKIGAKNNMETNSKYIEGLKK